MKNLIWFKDSIVAREKAYLSPMSASAQYGINVFEGMRAYKAKADRLAIFRYHDHMERLQSSVNIFGNNDKINQEDILRKIKLVIEANSFKEDIAIRVVLMNTNEVSWSSKKNLDLLIAPVIKGRTLDENKKGLSACFSSITRISNNSMSPQIKCGANYMNSRYGQVEAELFGFDTCIFINEAGFISEAPGSNVFLVKKNVLYTPSTSNGILLGITRDTIIKIAKECLNLEVVEGNLTRYDILNADEIFLCGSAMEIVPIISINHLNLNTDIVVKKIEQEYFRHVRGLSKNIHNNWLTYV
jgi:branched-chain amino acid aminotransferase